MSSKHCHSALNPLAPEYHPSTFTTTFNRPPQNHHYLHHYQPYFRPLRLVLPHNLYNPPTNCFLTTPTSFNNNTAPLPPSSPAAATTDQTSENLTHLEPSTRTRGATNLQRRRGGRRCVKQLRRRAPATVTTVEGNDVGSYNSNGGRERRRFYETRRRICGNTNDRERNKEVMELKRDVACTTVMIKNIPARYTRELLIKFLDKHCKAMNVEASNSEFTSAYDFMYLPVDFHTNANKGFAFVNFTDPRAAWRFYETSNNQLWELFRSSKIRQIVRAKLQGKVNLVKHFRGSTFHCESDDYLPVYFSPPRDGSAGQKVELTTVGYRVW